MYTPSIRNHIPIKIEKYQTSYFYETMPILINQFNDVIQNDFFKNLNNDTVLNHHKVLGTNELGNNKYSRITLTVYNDKTKILTNIKNRISEIRHRIIANTVALSKYQDCNAKQNLCLNSLIIIFDYVLKYSFYRMWVKNSNTLFIFPTHNINNTDNEISLLNKKYLYQEIITTNETIESEIFAPPKYIGVNMSTCAGFELKKPLNYVLGVGNSLEFLQVLSQNNDEIDIFKSRIDTDIENINNKIEIREKTYIDCQSYNKIIYFVNKQNNEEDPLFLGYYKTKLKKEYINVLKDKLYKFFNSRKIGSQSLNNNTVLYNTNNIETLNKEFIIRELKNTFDHKTDDINENIDNIQLLLEKIKILYKIHTDKNYKQSIVSSVNSNVFNIFMRFNILDTPVITDDIIAEYNSLYILKEYGKLPKIGYFIVNNKNKKQYIFKHDIIQTSYYKKKLGKEWDIIDKKVEKEKIALIEKNDEEEEKLEKEDDDKQIKEVLSLNMNSEKYDRTREILIEVQYELGRIIFRNIQKDITTKYNHANRIEYYQQRNVYEYYRWFNHRMIDATLADNTNIKYFKDTIYDVISLKEYLRSKKKLFENTRLALEFLKINSSPEILKYN